LEGGTLKQYDIIFLCNVPELSPLAAQNLQKYVTQGGSLVVFPGASSRVDFYNTDKNFSSLLPAKLGAVRDAPEPQKFLSWQSKDYAHPVVSLWNDPESGSLDSVKFFKYYPLTLKSDSTPVVLKYTNNEIAVAEQQAGKGRVFLFGGPATTDWSNFPVNPAFVPLLTRIVAYSTSTQGVNLNLPPGQVFSFEVESEYAGKDVSVQRIGKGKRQIMGRVEQGDHSAWLRYGDTELSGAYALYVGDDKMPKVVFAVQSDPAESDLRQQAQQDITALVNPPEPSGQQKTAANGEPDNRLVPGKELWFYLAIAALALAMLETIYAHYCSRTK
jgi:hypothetical protein